MNKQIPWQAKAALCEIFALGLRYPDATLVDALVSGQYSQALCEIAQANNLDVTRTPAALAPYTGTQSQDTLHALRVEHTRLFIGTPQPLISPYEGVWAANDDGVQPLLFVNPRTMEVERSYRAFGMGSPKNTNEPLDHIATELEFLEYLAAVEAGIATPNPAAIPPEDGYAQAYESFKTNHAQAWMPRFADEVTQQSQEPFFTALAPLLAAFAREEA
ncbi:MAG: molecular chaperone TorD family protein [Raoultibacter sp.]